MVFGGAAFFVSVAAVVGYATYVPLAASAAEGRAQRAESVPAAELGPWAAAVIAAHAYRHGVRLDGLTAGTPVDARTAAPVITDLYLRYARAVGFGQIEPRAARIPWDMKRSRFDPGMALAEVREAGLERALASLPPPHADYGRLVEALARYRAIALRGGWPAVPQGPVLALGSGDARVAVLRRRLGAEGHLSASETNGQDFDDRLEQAVIRFQSRQGLEPDGRVGPKTLAALNVPVAERIAQIVANMERWRWMPRALPLPRVEVNVPAAELGVLDAEGEKFRMRVVVGSRRHPTPLLQSEIRTVIINPPWNVPASIWRNEILPRLRHDPAYLAENDMRIVGRPHDPYGWQIDWRRRNEVPPGLRVQQQPGRFNALGRVKFEIPNRFDVYLHDTPVRSAFQRPERTLSHGCVRLQAPGALLQYLFRSQPSPALPAEDDGEPPYTRVVPVARPLPVFLVYRTAFVTPDGTVHFRNDIYGHDARIAALLVDSGKGVTGDLLAGGCGGKLRRGA